MGGVSFYGTDTGKLFLHKIKGIEQFEKYPVHRQRELVPKEKGIICNENL